jgi:DNA-binding response OmpR family regulator
MTPAAEVPAEALLVVEDDEAIGSVLAWSLSARGHDVVWTRTGPDTLKAASRMEFALVLLDLGLPDVDGIEVCRRIRADQPATVVVMLTAPARETDVIVALEAGADDYVVKPVCPNELLARMRAHMRRVGPCPPGNGRVHHAGDLRVDTGARRVSVGGYEVELRAKEFDLLAALIASPNTALSRETLMATVWDEHWFGSTRTLDVHVTALRRVFASVVDKGALPRIVALCEHGYRLETPDRFSDASSTASASSPRFIDYRPEMS